MAAAVAAVAQPAPVAARVIHEAVESNNVKALKALLNSNPGLINAPHGIYSRTPLQVAVLKKKMRALKFLLDRGAGVNEKDSGGKTALFLATEQNNHHVISMLLEKGADASIKNTAGTDALHQSIHGDHLAAFRLLLDHGGQDIDGKDSSGRTAMYLACENNRGRMLKLLLLAGADQTIAGNDRRTPRAIKWIYGRPACGKVFTWYDDELEKVYLLHRARQIRTHHSNHHSFAPSSFQAPAYVVARVAGQGELPSVEVVTPPVKGRGAKKAARPPPPPPNHTMVTRPKKRKAYGYDGCDGQDKAPAVALEDEKAEVEVKAKRQRKGKDEAEVQAVEEEMMAVLEYAVSGMLPELWVELLAGLRMK